MYKVIKEFTSPDFTSKGYIDFKLKGHNFKIGEEFTHYQFNTMKGNFIEESIFTEEFINTHFKRVK